LNQRNVEHLATAAGQYFLSVALCALAERAENPGKSMLASEALAASKDALASCLAARNPLIRDRLLASQARAQALAAAAASAS
jgi:hypothetical protein